MNLKMAEFRFPAETPFKAIIIIKSDDLISNCILIDAFIPEYVTFI